ncbi:hypothetical protein BD626DRAFT_539179 [Schizophyllum amplum]|uniref:Uncharacterized protein n=1 Tax=Schizophyllum amplum TaxID=97359 RepID=A0A550C4I6_9AGAR|nr:hypothetical protein BD626DRAFT_539179 [Auriculariopsis ampla]
MSNLPLPSKRTCEEIEQPEENTPKIRVVATNDLQLLVQLRNAQEEINSLTQQLSVLQSQTKGFMNAASFGISNDTDVRLNKDARFVADLHIHPHFAADSPLSSSDHDDADAQNSSLDINWQKRTAALEVEVVEAVASHSISAADRQLTVTGQVSGKTAQNSLIHTIQLLNKERAALLQDNEDLKSELRGKLLSVTRMPYTSHIGQPLVDGDPIGHVAFATDASKNRSEQTPDKGWHADGEIKQDPGHQTVAVSDDASQLLSSLEQQLRSKDAELRLLNDQFNAFRIEALNTKADAHAELDRLRASSADNVKLANALKYQFENTQGELAALGVQFKHQVALSTELQSKHAKLKMDKAALLAQEVVLQEQLNGAHAELGPLRTKSADNARLATALRGQLENTEAELAALRARLVDQAGLLSEMEKERSGSETDKAVLIAQQMALQNQLKETAEMLALSQGSCFADAEEATALQEQLKGAHAELGSLRTEAADDARLATELRDQLENTEAELAALRARLVDQAGLLSEMEKERSGSETDKAVLIAQQMALQNQLKETAEMLALSQGSCFADAEEATALQEQLKGAHAELGSLRTEAADDARLATELRDQLENMQIQLTALKEQATPSTELESMNTKLRMDKAALLAQEVVLQEQLKGAHAELGPLRTKSADNARLATALRGQLENTEAELAALRARLVDQAGLLSEMEKERSGSETDKAVLIAQQMALQNQLKETAEMLALSQGSCFADAEEATALQEQLKGAHAELGPLRTKSADDARLATALRGQLENTEAELAALRARLVDQAGLLSEMEKERSGSETDKAVLIAQQMALQNQLKETAEMLALSQGSCFADAEEATALQEQLKGAHAELGSLRTEAADDARLATELRDQLENMQIQLTALKEQATPSTELESMNTKLRMDKAALLAQEVVLQEQLKGAHAELGPLRTKSADNARLATALRGQLENTEAELTALRARLVDQAGLLSEMEKERSGSETDQAVLVAQKVALQDQLKDQEKMQQVLFDRRVRQPLGSIVKEEEKPAESDQSIHNILYRGGRSFGLFETKTDPSPIGSPGLVKHEGLKQNLDRPTSRSITTVFSSVLAAMMWQAMQCSALPVPLSLLLSKVQNPMSVSPP